MRAINTIALIQVLCSSTTAFAPSPRFTLHNKRSILGAAVAETKRTSSVETLMDRPYFADFTDNEEIMTVNSPLSLEATEDNASNINCMPTAGSMNSSRQPGMGKTAIVAGGTGYIGRACVRECVARGYNTIALVRDPIKASADDALSGASLVKCDVTNANEVQRLFKEISLVNNESVGSAGSSGSGSAQPAAPVDMVISCLASPSGVESEVYAIDYQATLNLLDAGRDVDVGARHFVLLSAFCCRNPTLKLQQAKLKFEEQLSKQSEMTYSIVRPTAFFKSVSGQYESIMDGNSYVLFGDGAVTQCNPIAEEELAEYMCDSALEEFKEERWGKILNIGGPDAPLTNKMLGELMFKAAGKPPKFVYVPTEIFDFSISLIEFIAKTWPSQKWEDVLETSKIGKYYAVEDMLTTEESEKFGKISMMDHFEKIAREGQDPFTPVRATAVISKALEALPAMAISIPLGFGFLCKPDMVMASSSQLPDLALIMAGLSDNNVIS